MQIYSKSMKNAASPLFRNHNRSALEVGTYITHRVIYYSLVFCFLFLSPFIIIIIIIIIIIAIIVIRLLLLLLSLLLVVVLLFLFYSSPLYWHVFFSVFPLHSSQDEHSFTEDEEEKLEGALGMERKELHLVLETTAFILEQVSCQFTLSKSSQSTEPRKREKKINEINKSNPKSGPKTYCAVCQFIFIIYSQLRLSRISGDLTNHFDFDEIRVTASKREKIK